MRKVKMSNLKSFKTTFYFKSNFLIYERGIRRPLLGLSPYTTWTFLSKNLTFDWP